MEEKHRGDLMSEVRMPQLGETVVEGTITQWFKQVGEEVAEDEPLFEVSTDKVDSEVPSPMSGVLLEIVAAEGETVEVGAVIAILGETGTASVPSVPVSEPVPLPSVPVSEPVPLPSVPVSEPVPVSPVPEPSPELVEESSAQLLTGEAMVLSPVVRRLIHDNELDPSRITGTGKGGRITRADVEAVISQNRRAGGPPAPAPTSAPPAPSRASGRDTIVPLSNIRRITGEHMVRSKAVAPHVLTAVEVDFERVEQVRQAHRQQFRADNGFSLTYLPFIVRAVCDSLHAYPHINASVGDGELVVHNYVNLAVAVDLDFQGLLAPVVVDADRKRLVPIAQEIADLSQRARAKKLNADEISGGTFTLTNPGQWGTMMQFPIINQPQVAILSTDGIRRRPVVITGEDGTEAIAIHSVGVLALAWDHRAFDGAYVAAFLDHLRSIIETRDWHAEIP
ncbi:dihydrolipoamide acetyltransferase family protein [Candidatus Poriferisocius sp.]|uniref:dihydrolipoamide acetyltransferase family protein n=1 Tax=Candidatus Poriferisocius sp. TaxID=3101276 RepID=UPI003B01DF7C